MSVCVVDGVDANSLPYGRNGGDTLNLRTLELSFVLLTNLRQGSAVPVDGDVVGRVPVTRLLPVWIKTNGEIACCGILAVTPRGRVIARPVRRIRDRASRTEERQKRTRFGASSEV